MALMRVDGTPVLLVETHLTIRSEGRGAVESIYGTRGFEPAHGPLRSQAATAAAGYELTTEGGSVVLCGPDGPEHRFEGLPAAWLAAAEGRAVLVLIGNRLGLERFDQGRVDEAMQLGEVMGALVALNTDAGD